MTTNEETKRSMVRLGENMTRIMERDGITISEVYRRTGMSKTSITDTMRGNRFPTMFTMMRLRDALGCSWADLMDNV